MIGIVLPVVGALLFCFSFGTVVAMRKSLFSSLVCLQFAVLGVVMSFVGFSCLWQDAFGQLFALVIIAMGAINACVGLGIFVVYRNVHGNVSVEG